MNNMPEIQLCFNYDVLDPETRAFVLERAERIHNLARMTATGIVQIGQYLTEVKAKLKHGQYLEWIEREFGWGDDSARNFMRVFELSKSRNFRDLEIDVSALYLIAAPKTPEPVRRQVVQRAENGEPVTHAGVRALVQRFAETGEIPDIQVSLPQLIAERRALMQPQAKPESPSPEEQQARAEDEELRVKMKANSERVVKVFNVIGSIECLSGTALTVPEIAAEIRRLDTPDKDWRGQLKIARRKLADLATELSE
jgi:Protein of unknown function (DUF3102)